jgi:hypothetical protein
MLHFLRRCGNEAQPEAIEARIDRARHHLGRGELEYRQCGKTDRTRQGFPFRGVNAAAKVSPERRSSMAS